MIDIHSHILFDVDDGSDTITESVALIKSALAAGVTEIILTPHYTGNTKEDYRNENVDKHFSELVKQIKDRGIKINIYLGNEVAVYGNICDILDTKVAKTLAGSRYMLIEFPMEADVNYCLDTEYEMKMRGITPIIAHPERCECFKKDYSLVEKAVQEGACIQVNVGSVFGDYGSKAKKIARKLLKSKLVNFLAIDNHHIIRDKYTDLPKRIRKLNRMFGAEYINGLTVYNQEKILRNEEI